MGLRSHLSVEEEGVGTDGDHDDRDLLPDLVGAIGGADEGGHGESEGGEHDDHDEVVRDARAIVGERPMPQPADEQTQADDRAEDDHRHRHHRITGDRRVIARAQQHRGDEDDLDEADRDRQHERTVGIAEAVC